jgi:CRP-like cAMP-binding protein
VGISSTWVGGRHAGRIGGCQLGPGAIAGERALLEEGVRTATLRAVTDCVVAVAGRDQVDRDRLAELAAPRHREDLPDR